MDILAKISSEEFNTQREEWENLLRTELKLTEVGEKDRKRTIDGGVWATLSLGPTATRHLPPTESWKRASQSFGPMDRSTLDALATDLAQGVRVFFLEKRFLDNETWGELCRRLNSSSNPDEIFVVLLGPESFSGKGAKFQIFDENQAASGRRVHDQGGSLVQELALMTCELIEKLEAGRPVGHLMVFSDSQFFRGIAKLRAARLLGMKVLQEKGIAEKLSVLALSSYREWTLFERYSNILRNDSAVASAYIGGADFVQSSGHQLLFEFLGLKDPDEEERSRRVCRNATHILALESLLGTVQDAAFGSYHLESLTENFASLAWAEMQRLLPLSPENRRKVIEEDALKVREQRLLELKKRKRVLAGINDFPDPKEVLPLRELPSLPFFRAPEIFEALRLRMSNLASRPEVHVGVLGDPAQLNARLNFVKNYFQLLGLSVEEVFDVRELEQKSDVVVLCAPDEEYPKLGELKLAARERFVAGKVALPGFHNLFAGQDVHSGLTDLLGRWEGK